MDEVPLPALRPGQVPVLDNYVVHGGDSIAKLLRIMDGVLLHHRPPPALIP